MTYLLDTDHITILQTRSEPGFTRLRHRIRRLKTSDLAYSLISFHEQVIGAHAYLNRARKSAELVAGYARLSRLLSFYAEGTVLGFDVEATIQYDRLLATRTRIDAMDLRIAAIALSRGLTLLTRNMRDFAKIEGLITEDWLI